MSDVKTPKQIIMNAFDMNCVGHINHGLWTHPRDHSTEFNQIQHWTEQAQLLEKGLFDGLFLADIVGVYDVYQNNIDLTLKESIQLPSHDPLLLISAMAATTQHLGFGVTVNLSYESPYLLARRFSTLDHLTQGRIGWNIVTGYLDSAAKAMGFTELLAHDLRYDQAEEFLDVAYQLWESSWEDDAVLINKTQRVYAQPAKVHKIKHQGPYYQVAGYHLSAPSPQRTPLLFQAGASSRGTAFAAQHAECIFISGNEKHITKQQVDTIRAQVQATGRDPDNVKILMGINVIVAETEIQAHEKYQEYLRYASPEAGLAHFSSSTGIDFAQYGLDEAIPYRSSNAIASVNDRFKHETITPRDLLEQHKLGGRYRLIIGSASQVAAELIDWVDQTGIDGFNLARIVTPESYADFIEWVVPELQQRKRYKTAYASGVWREKIFNTQAPYLNAPHPAGVWRTRKKDAHELPVTQERELT
ncbi:LLM class flavin-dependent oxidoreductase [Aquirhabdus parva]|uniref:FMN-dependent monooxygenase n=1 Tax=Aquirhabdus parva TaxID=2283318 RepID=A0A345P7S9_9GAMM|nr:LLM class flavin-dependent oxidoreductase [Aquirhabdus parva]AXI03338.1 FMN-dependent monooxygenase [Aquirhabdus parva]